MIATREALQARAWQQAEWTGCSDARTAFCQLVLAAAVYWEGISVDDFCVQHVGDGSVVFGGTNRLRWTAATGFRPEPGYCTERFLARARELGPLPGPGAKL